MKKEKLNVLCYKNKESRTINVELNSHNLGEKSYIIKYSGNGRVEIDFLKNILFEKILSNYLNDFDLEITCANMPLLSELRSNKKSANYYKHADFQDKQKMDVILDFISNPNVTISKSIQLTEEIVNNENVNSEKYSLKSMKNKINKENKKRVLIIKQNQTRFIIEKYNEDGTILNTESLKFDRDIDAKNYFEELRSELINDKYRIQINDKNMVEGMFNGISEKITDKERLKFLEKKYSIKDVLYLMKMENPDRPGFFVYNVFILDINNQEISGYKSIISDGNDKSTLNILNENIRTFKESHKNYKIEKIIYDGLEEDSNLNNNIKNDINNTFNIDENNESDIDLLLNINQIFINNNVQTNSINESQKMLSNLISLNEQPTKDTLKIYCDASVSDPDAKMKQSTFGIVFRKPSSDIISLKMSGRVKTNYSIKTNDAEMWGIHYSLIQIEKMMKERKLSNIKNIEISCDNINVVKFYNGIFESKKGNDIEIEIKKRHKKAFELLERINKNFSIKISWVKGHSVNIYNCECDRLAKEAWKKFPALNDFSKLIEVKSQIEYIENDAFKITPRTNMLKFK